MVVMAGQGVGSQELGQRAGARTCGRGAVAKSLGHELGQGAVARTKLGARARSRGQTLGYHDLWPGAFCRELISFFPFLAPFLLAFLACFLPRLLPPRPCNGQNDE